MTLGIEKSGPPWGIARAILSPVQGLTVIDFRGSSGSSADPLKMCGALSPLLLPSPLEANGAHGFKLRCDRFTGPGPGLAFPLGFHHTPK